MTRRPALERWAAPVLSVLACLAAAAVIVPLANQRERVRDAAMLTGGSPDRGEVALQRYGCISCHEIPGVRGASGKVGPPLAGIAERTYLGGVLTNSVGNMMYWVQHPQDVDPLTAMPDTGVTDADARDIAAYLYTLR